MRVPRTLREAPHPNRRTLCVGLNELLARWAETRIWGFGAVHFPRAALRSALGWLNHAPLGQKTGRLRGPKALEFFRPMAQRRGRPGSALGSHRPGNLPSRPNRPTD